MNLFFRELEYTSSLFLEFITVFHCETGCDGGSVIFVPRCLISLSFVRSNKTSKILNSRRLFGKIILKYQLTLSQLMFRNHVVCRGCICEDSMKFGNRGLPSVRNGHSIHIKVGNATSNNCTQKGSAHGDNATGICTYKEGSGSTAHRIPSFPEFSGLLGTILCLIIGYLNP